MTDKKKAVLKLNYPPSVNKLYATCNGRRVLTRNAKEYKNRSFLTLRTRNMLPDSPIFDHNVTVHLLATPPDNRRRDSDNILKITFDTLVYCRILTDDSLIKEHSVYFAEPSKENCGVTIVIDEHDYNDSFARFLACSGVNDV